MDGMKLLPHAPFRLGALLHAHIAGLPVRGYIMSSKKLIIIVFVFFFIVASSLLRLLESFQIRAAGLPRISPEQFLF